MCGLVRRNKDLPSAMKNRDTEDEDEDEDEDEEYS